MWALLMITKRITCQGHKVLMVRYSKTSSHSLVHGMHHVCNLGLSKRMSAACGKAQGRAENVAINKALSSKFLAASQALCVADTDDQPCDRSQGRRRRRTGCAAAVMPGNTYAGGAALDKLCEQPRPH